MKCDRIGAVFRPQWIGGISELNVENVRGRVLRGAATTLRAESLIGERPVMETSFSVVEIMTTSVLHW
jgi:hypothetical protein